MEAEKFNIWRRQLLRKEVRRCAVLQTQCTSTMLPDERHNTKRQDTKIEWADLRTRSLQPGGFGDERVDIWPRLLHVSKSSARRDTATDEKPPHEDERQISLDTNRSFVLYPVDPKYNRDTLQAGLHKLLVSLFRNRPRLGYFQGYHDIVTVIFLTLPEELQLPCIEKLSLHRVRDSMGAGLEPVLGLLRVTNNLLQLADPEYACLLKQTSPLPFHALSNLLTLFSHDMPTLPLIQHVFDYLLCRPPIAVVYLAAAIIILRKQEVLRLDEEDEDGMIHSLLSSLPNLVDGDEDGAQTIEKIVDLEDSSAAPWIKEEGDAEAETTDVDSDNTFFKEEEGRSMPLPKPSTLLPDLELDEKKGSSPDETIVEHDLHMASTLAPDKDVGHIHESEPRLSPSQAAVISGSDDPSSDELGFGPDNISLSTVSTDPSPPPASKPVSELGYTHSSLLLTANASVDVPAINPEIPIITEKPFIHPVDSIKVEENAGLKPVSFENDDRKPVSESENQGRYQYPVHLIDLLKQADALYAKFPPSHEGLCLSAIMGPQSVVYTWSENSSDLPSDNTAEAMVLHPELVVYPYVEPEPEAKEGEWNASETEPEKEGGWGFRRRRGKERANLTKTSKYAASSSKKRRKNKLRKTPFSQMEKRTMVAGTVLVLSVALAIYGIKARTAASGSGGLLFTFANANGVRAVASASAGSRDWRRIGGWVGGALVGMSEKIINGLSSATDSGS